MIQMWKLLQMGVKPATGGLIPHIKRLEATMYQERELFISGAEEIKNRPNPTAPRSCLGIPAVAVAIARFTQRAKVQSMKT